MRLFSDVTSTIEHPLLRRAYELAELGRGTTSPNPLVGCVIAQDDEIVGEGFHARAGEAHAETKALAEAGPRAAGATAYVTLEPCNHHGRTPPCSEAIVTRGVAHVVIGMPDPNPVAVGGAVRLREAGLEVEFAANPEPFRIQNEAWLHHLQTGRPFVQVKTAVSLDGHSTSMSGARCSITGLGGADVTMALRAAADAVVVGAATARIDDPALTVRDSCGRPCADQPVRAILTRGDVPRISLFDDGLGRSVVVAPRGAVAGSAAEVIEYDSPGGLRAAFRALGDAGLVRVLVEAGPNLLTALLDEAAADEYVFVHAGGMVGPCGPPLFLGDSHVADGHLQCALSAFEAGIIGTEAVTVWRPSGANARTTERGD